MSAKILDLRRRRVGLPVLAEKDVFSVRCPRKGPTGSEISVVICGEIHAQSPAGCAAHGCESAVKYAAQIAQLRAQTAPPRSFGT